MRNLTLNIAEKSNFLRSLKRHYSFFFKYLTFKKISNLILSFLEFKFRVSNCRSYPSYLRFETSSVCNLRCAGCSIGGATNNSIALNSTAFITFENFKKSINDFLPYLLKVNLYDEGEPLLNKDIYDITKYLHEKKVATCISTNFSIKLSDNDLNKIIDSKLDHLIVALDGYDQLSYSKYRIGGDFDLVINNIKKLNKLSKEKKSNLKIETQFIEFPDTTIEEINKVYNLASSLGVWRHTILEKGSRLGWEGYHFKGTPDERKELGCYYIWFSGSILTNGEYYACDFGEDSGMKSIGKAAEFIKEDLHNHKSTLEIRESFKNGSLNEICAVCPQTYKKVKK